MTEEFLPPQQAFKQLLASEIAPLLEARGFSRSHQTFYLRREENWGIINFQKSISSNAGRVVFTVGVGVQSGILSRFGEFASGEPQVSRPDIWTCTWSQRLGELMPGNGGVEKWWVLDSQTALEPLGQELRDAISDFAIPAIEKYISNKGLRDMWLYGISHRVSEFGRVRALSVLLKAIGPVDLLPSTLEELQRLAGDNARLTHLAQEHMRQLERWSPND